MMFCVLILCNVFCNVVSYKVLVVSPYTLNSYQVIEKSIVKHLLKDGHSVTYLSENIIENSTPRLKQEHFQLDYLDTEISETQRTKELLKNGRVKEFLKNPNNNFDVVISTWLHNNMIAGIAAIFQCPIIWLVTIESTDTLSVVTSSHNLHQKKCIWSNVFHTLRGISYFTKNPEELTYKELFEPIAKSRGISLPNYEVLMYNTSVLYLTHPSLSYNLEIPPYVKYLGGIHIEDETTHISEDLQKILNTQEYGVVYFNMGYDNKHIFTKSEINIFLNVFKELNQTVFWQHEEELKDLPRNVIVKKYFPHFRILDHQNTRVIITDSSVTSINEAVYYAVPILNILTDRYTDNLTNKNISNIVYLEDKLYENLKSALIEILSNESLSFNADDLSDVYHDRILPSSEEFKGWVNYVCKKGIKHLHIEKLNTYELYGLDLIALFTCFILFVFTFIWCYKNRAIVQNCF